MIYILDVLIKSIIAFLAGKRSPVRLRYSPHQAEKPSRNRRLFLFKKAKFILDFL